MCIPNGQLKEGEEFWNPGNAVRRQREHVCLTLSETCWSAGHRGGVQGAGSRLGPSNTQDTEVAFKVIEYREWEA